MDKFTPNILDQEYRVKEIVFEMESIVSQIHQANHAKNDYCTFKAKKTHKSRPEKVAISCGNRISSSWHSKRDGTKNENQPQQSKKHHFRLSNSEGLKKFWNIYENGLRDPAQILSCQQTIQNNGF